MTKVVTLETVLAIGLNWATSEASNIFWAVDDKNWLDPKYDVLISVVHSMFSLISVVKSN